MSCCRSGGTGNYILVIGEIMFKMVWGPRFSRAMIVLVRMQTMRLCFHIMRDISGKVNAVERESTYSLREQSTKVNSTKGCLMGMVYCPSQMEPTLTANGEVVCL